MNRAARPVRIGFLSRSRNRRGLSLPEAMVSLSIMSMFMTMCCGSMVQYQNVFGRVERSMTYTQQLQVGLDVMMRDIAESNISTFTDNQNVPLSFPVDLSQTPVILKVAAGTNGHGDNFYSTFRIRLSVNADNELVREILVPGESPLPKTLAGNVEKVIFSLVTDCDENGVCVDMDNALSVSATSTTLISARDQAFRDRAAENAHPSNCGSGQTSFGGTQQGHVCIEFIDPGLIHDDITQIGGSTVDTYAHEKKSVSIERIVRLNN